MSACSRTRRLAQSAASYCTPTLHIVYDLLVPAALAPQDGFDALALPVFAEYAIARLCEARPLEALFDKVGVGWPVDVARAGAEDDQAARTRDARPLAVLSRR